MSKRESNEGNRSPWQAIAEGRQRLKELENTVADFRTAMDGDTPTDLTPLMRRTRAEIEAAREQFFQAAQNVRFSEGLNGNPEVAEIVAACVNTHWQTQDNIDGRFHDGSDSTAHAIKGRIDDTQARTELLFNPFNKALSPSYLLEGKYKELDHQSHNLRGMYWLEQSLQKATAALDFQQCVLDVHASPTRQNLNKLREQFEKLDTLAYMAASDAAQEVPGRSPQELEEKLDRTRLQVLHFNWKTEEFAEQFPWRQDECKATYDKTIAASDAEHAKEEEWINMQYRDETFKDRYKSQTGDEAAHKRLKEAYIRSEIASDLNQTNRSLREIEANLDLAECRMYPTESTQSGLPGKGAKGGGTRVPE